MRGGGALLELDHQTPPIGFGFQCHLVDLIKKSKLGACQSLFTWWP